MLNKYIGRFSEPSAAPYHPLLNLSSVKMAQGGEWGASDYSLLEELGSGSFGTVFKAIQRSNSEVVAIKMAFLPSKSVSDLADSR